MQLQYSPVAALNRTYALARVRGKAMAIGEAEKLKLEGNPFYFALLGELYTGVDDLVARGNYARAMELAKTEADRAAMKRRMDSLG